jgi:hypothetical protein
MISRQRILVTAAAAGILMAHGISSFAQVNPADMRSGSLRVLTGITPVVIFTVPAGQVFVLTDIEWSTTASAGDASPVSLNLYGDTTERWRMRGAYQYTATSSFVPPVIQSHFSTGLVFNSGEVVSFESGSQLAGHSYSLNWSGYIAPSGTSAVGDAGVPMAPAMQQNAPNPFNPETRINYALGTAGVAQLRVFDSSGRLVRTLVDGQQEAGQHSVVWDGTNNNGTTLASGVYFYELNTDQGHASRKALMLK